jgi:DNA repair ATPase RecN
VNEVDLENKTVHLTSFELPDLDPQAVKARDDKIQAKDDLEQANSEMDEAAKLAELAAVLDNDEEIMAQVKKMLDSYGNDVEFVNLKVSISELQVRLNKRTTLVSQLKRFNALFCLFSSSI